MTATASESHHDDTTTNNNSKEQDDFLAAMFATTNTSAAPVVGPHHKNSLVGFDPLLTPSSVSSATESSSRMTDPHPLLKSVPSPPYADKLSGSTTRNKHNGSPVDQQIAVDSSEAKPPPPPPRTPPPNEGKKAGSSTPLANLFRKKKVKKGHRKAKSLISLPTGDAFKSEEVPKQAEVGSLSPPRVAQKTPAVAAPSQATSPPPPSTNQSTPTRGIGGKMLPWPMRNNKHQGKGGGHRKTMSMTALPSKTLDHSKPQQQQQQQQQPASSASTSPVVAREAIASMSPMIQDLLQMEQETGGVNGTAITSPPSSLFAPSLAKPRPTSFLTGQEQVARSSEQEPSAWQLEIPDYPDVLSDVKLCQFMDTYGTEECLLDLSLLVGINRMDLLRFARGDGGLTSITTKTEIADCHRPIVEALLECGNDISEVKGFFTSADNDGSPDSRREVLILERQNKFVCVFRGTAAEQHGKFAKNPETVQLQDGLNATVCVDRYAAFAELQASTFQLLDTLTEDNPFCDIMFTGTSFGSAMAILAAYSYANTRTALRVSCVTSAVPKIGLDDFRWAAHSSPNLNMWRLEYGTGRHHVRAATHVGHVIRISSSPKDTEQPVIVAAYKFGDDDENHHPLRGSLIAKQKDRNVNEYVSVLEDLGSGQWVTDFYHEDGAGVRGKDNEAREMA